MGYFRVRARSGCSASWGTWTTTPRTYEPTTTYLEREVAFTPRWRRIRNTGGILPVNPYVVGKCEIKRTACSGQLNETNGTCSVRQYETSDYYYEGHEAQPWHIASPSGGDISAAVNSAIKAASAGTIQLAVSALEARSTLDLLRGASKRLYDLVKACAGTAKKKGIPFDSAWLEYRYGWMQLVYDIQAAVDTFNRRIKEGERLHGTGVRAGGDNSSSSGVITGAASDLHWSRTWTSSWRVRGFALTQVELPTITQYGLNPVSVAWEYTRLSFLVDWFLDIGSWLASNTTGLSGVSLKSSGYSVKTTSSETVVVTVVGKGNTSGAFSGQTCTSLVERFERHPHPGGGFPSFNFSVKPANIADIVALLTQAIQTAYSKR